MQISWFSFKLIIKILFDYNTKIKYKLLTFGSSSVFISFTEKAKLIKKTPTQIYNFFCFSLGEDKVYKEIKKKTLDIHNEERDNNK